MHKRTPTVGILFLLMFSIIIPISLGNNVTISNTTQKLPNPLNLGNILYVGGSGPGNYTIIQDAIDNASDGDTVFVFDDSSPYPENVTVDKSIQLIGEEKNTTIIDCEGNGSVIFISNDQVTVSGFTLQNSGDAFYNGGVEIRSNYNLITGNIMIYNKNGVSIKNCKENTISKNIIRNNTEGTHPNIYYGGIYIKDSNYNHIIENIIENNDNPGLFLWSSHYNEIKGNVVRFNKGSGIRLGVERDWKSNSNIISGNIIRGNTGRGIYIGEGSGNVIRNNNFEDNSIYLFLSKNTLISKNNFFKGGASFAYIFEERKSYNNEWTSNYWLRPRYFPKFIKGSVGYVQGWVGYFPLFPWIQIDWTPAKEPYDI